MTRSYSFALPSFFLILLLFVAGCKSTETISDDQQSVDYVVPPLFDPSDSEMQIPEIVPVSPDVNVDSLLNSMSLRDKIAQLFIVPAYGSFTNENEPRYLRLKRLVAEHNVGGIIFMQGDVYGQGVMTNELQQLAKIPLWITQDMEFGAAMRVRGTTRFTPAMGIAATQDPENAYLKGVITAREAKALGVHQIFAPVLDVNNNPDNPVINVRSYGGVPEIVAEYGNYFIRGIESEGILATAKHFPGHGDTDTDSHLALPTIGHDFERIQNLELVPFKVNIESGLKSIMSAHIAYPNISENIGRPSTLDESVLNRILIDSLGFDGLVVTDGLEMQGITNHYAPGEAVVLALRAGADLMLISPDELTAIDDVYDAIQIGRLSEERVDRSVRKLLELKKNRGVLKDHTVDLASLNNQINTLNYQAIANSIARQSLTVLSNDKDILPITDAKFPSVLVVTVADDKDGDTGSNLAREMRKYHQRVVYHNIDQRTTDEEKIEIMEAARQADLLVIGSFIMVRSHQPIQLPDELKKIVTALTDVQKPSVLMAFGNPYVVRDIPGADAHVLAWSSSSNQVEQSVPGLFAAEHVNGRLTSEIPGMYPIGSGLSFNHTALRFDIPEAVEMRTDSLIKIDMIMQHAINDSMFPGGVVGVMKDGALVWNEGYGYHDYSKTTPVSDNDVYDLASLTKVMGTTTAVMKLVDEGRLALDDKVANYIPEFDTEEKREITIEQMLLHTSGLPAFKIYVDKLKTRGEIMEAIKNEPLEYEPGTDYVYSDLGFILLAEIVEEISGDRIDIYLRNNFFAPMGMYSTHYNPKSVGGWMTRRIPPTEIDDVYNRGTVQAVVHDERAYFMEGVAGHAGLFSNARDIAIFTQMLLNGGTYAGRDYLSPEIIEQFTSHQSPINQRAYGFDMKSDGFSTAGSLTSENSFGHTGFTGTSLWVDPNENISIILLTNRTYPDRDLGRGISRVRADVADAIMKSLQTE
ncbi:glycoside hydrolase family 3 N-terminal domain-containing protein [Rhodohalobacter sp. 8-1]|uniref:glycoside hydrolase family 3 N-terminal domain-containing protein n=1 Tax=Rhodohalobacter sp. 8-1 TaxID=3131972 RepID=UPI0030EDF5BA